MPLSTLPNLLAVLCRNDTQIKANPSNAAPCSHGFVGQQQTVVEAYPVFAAKLLAHLAEDTMICTPVAMCPLPLSWSLSTNMIVCIITGFPSLPTSKCTISTTCFKRDYDTHIALHSNHKICRLCRELWCFRLNTIGKIRK